MSTKIISSIEKLYIPGLQIQHHRNPFGYYIHTFEYFLVRMENGSRFSSSPALNRVETVSKIYCFYLFLTPSFSKMSTFFCNHPVNKEFFTNNWKVIQTSNTEVSPWASPAPYSIQWWKKFKQNFCNSEPGLILNFSVRYVLRNWQKKKVGIKMWRRIWSFYFSITGFSLYQTEK